MTRPPLTEDSNIVDHCTRRTLYTEMSYIYLGIKMWVAMMSVHGRRSIWWKVCKYTPFVFVRTVHFGCCCRCPSNFDHSRARRKSREEKLKHKSRAFYHSYAEAWSTALQLDIRYRLVTVRREPTSTCDKFTQDQECLHC